MVSAEGAGEAGESATAGEGTEHSAEGESSEGLIVYIDLWVFISLLLAVFIIYLRLYIKLPRSGMMMLAGIFLRCVGEHVGMLTETVRMMDNIEAETIMLIFLPALISECAFQTDWYTFWKEKMQIGLLATTAVVLSSFLTAVVIRYILQYVDEFEWYSALMLGAILSATDHVAVVAQLKEIKADKHLETLIQGETLVNDGTVIVLFSAMMKGATGSAATAGDVTELYFRLSLGGIALGLGFGWCLSIWLSKIVNQPIIEILLTVATPYLLFFTADATEVNFSGALGTVTLGLYMSAYGKIMISQEVEETLHEFWELLGASFEALTLILGGMLMGHFFYNFESLEHGDIGMLFALFALLHVVRAVTILIHWPFLRVMGYGCSFKDVLVLIFGALKGTISIALSLMVFHNTGFDERTRDLVLFWSVGVSALSAFFDAYLFSFLVKALGLENMSNIEENMLLSVTTSISDASHKFISKLKKGDEFTLANWEMIMKEVGPDPLLHDIINATKNGKMLQGGTTGSSKDLVKTFTNRADISREEIVLETRKRFFTTLKGVYWRLFEHRQCFGNSVLALIHSANLGIDCKKEVMQDWVKLESATLPHVITKVLKWGTSKSCLSWLFRKCLYSYVTHAYDLGRSFITAHIEAEKLLDDMEIDIDAQLFEEVMSESREQIALAKIFITDHIQNAYPEVFMYIQTKHAMAKIIDREFRSIEEAYRRGVITEIENEELMKSIERKFCRYQHLSNPKKPTVFELLRSSELFKDIDSEKLSELASHLTDELVAKEGSLFADHSHGSGIYVVIHGRIREAGKSFSFDHAAGEVIGLQYLLPNYEGPSSSFTAVTTAKVVFIPRTEIDTMHHYEKFERDLWFMGAKKLFVLCKNAFGQVGDLDSARLSTLLSNSKLVKYQSGREIPLAYGTIFLQGGVSSGHSALSYLPGVDRSAAVAVGETVVLQFKEDFGRFVRSADSDLKAAISAFETKGEGPQSLKITKKSAHADTIARVLTNKLASLGRRIAPEDNATSNSILTSGAAPKSGEDEGKLDSEGE